MSVIHTDTTCKHDRHFPKHPEELCLCHVKIILISTGLLNNPSGNQFNYTVDREVYSIYGRTPIANWSFK